MNLFGYKLGGGKTNSRVARSGGQDSPLANVQSEPTSNELGVPLPPAPSYGTEHDLIELVKDRVQQASMQRRVAEREWTLSVAMYEDRQWLTWDESANQAISLLTADEQDKQVTYNMIAPLIDKLIGLSTMSKPDASPAPMSDSPLDRAAAAEARAITAHLWRLHKRQLQTLDVVWWALVCGVCYLKESWDPDMMATVGIPGPDGSTARKVAARIGEVDSNVIAPYLIYIDPRARRFDKAAWVVHEDVMDLAVIEETYGIKVDPDANLSGAWFDSYLPENSRFGGVSSLGPVDRTSHPKRAARVMINYERPTPAFPEGRTLCCTQDRLLYAGPMPMTDKEKFPFARLAFKEAAAHPYGLGLVRTLMPVQIGLNRYITKIVNRVEAEKNTIMIPKNAGIGAEAFIDDIDVQESMNFRRVYFNSLQDGSGPPVWTSTPPLNDDVWKALDFAWGKMQDIAGIHDVNMGGTPTGMTAGVAIELLQQGDRTQLSGFTQRIEQMTVDRDELDIALYAQYASSDIPRMMGLDDTGNAQAAQTQIMAFKALTAGGSVGIVVVPGSATPKSAAGKTQELLELYKMGAFAPDNPANQILLRLMSLPKSDQILDMMQMIQGQMLQAQQQQQANQPPPPNPTQTAAIQQQGETQRLQMQIQGDQQKQTMQLQGQAYLNYQEAQLKMALAARQHLNTMGSDVIKSTLNHETAVREQIAKTALELYNAHHMPEPQNGRTSLKDKGN